MTVAEEAESIRRQIRKLKEELRELLEMQEEQGKQDDN